MRNPHVARPRPLAPLRRVLVGGMVPGQNPTPMKTHLALAGMFIVALAAIILLAALVP